MAALRLPCPALGVSGGGGEGGHTEQWKGPVVLSPLPGSSLGAEEVMCQT